MTENKEDIEWVKKAISLGLTRLEIKVKLEQAHFTENRINSIIKLYEKEKEEITAEIIKEDIKNPIEEEKFEKSVKEYINGNEEKLSFFEKRRIKKWQKDIKKYSEIMKRSIKHFNEAIEKISKFDEKKREKELNYLKSEIIDCIIDSKQILDIEDPETGEEATKESLEKCKIEALIELMELNVDELDLIVNGKIQKEEK